MASALHEAGLDWWYTRATNSQLRFGRKELGAGKGTPVGSFYLQHEGIRVRQVLTSPGGEAETAMISDDLLQRIEAVIDGDGGWQERLGNRPTGPDTGRWITRRTAMRARQPRSWTSRTSRTWGVGARE